MTSKRFCKQYYKNNGSRVLQNQQISIHVHKHYIEPKLHMITFSVDIIFKSDKRKTSVDVNRTNQIQLIGSCVCVCAFY